MSKKGKRPADISQKPTNIKQSIIGEKDFFWIRDDRNGDWILGRLPYGKNYDKNGNRKPKATWIEEKRVSGIEDGNLTADVLKQLAQVESDLLFELASGERPQPT
jgi:hypothetical protein